MKNRLGLLQKLTLVAVGIVLAGCVHTNQCGKCAKIAKIEDWRGVHFMSIGPEGLPLLKRTIEEVLVPLDVNVIVYEIDYNFEFEEYPELRGGNPLSKEDARDLARSADRMASALFRFSLCRASILGEKHASLTQSLSSIRCES